MITERARQLAGQRMLLLEERLRAPKSKERSSSSPDDADTETGRRAAALMIEHADALRLDPIRLSPAQAAYAAERLAGLEGRAVRAEVAFGRLRGRRMVRLVGVLGGWVRRPWRLGVLFSGLRSAFRKRVLPELPEVMPSAEGYVAELVGVVADEVEPDEVEPRPLPYPHLRVAHAGRIAMFSAVAPHFPVAEVDLEAELAIGFDMLVVEPGVDDPLDGLDSELLARFREAEIPVLYVARTTAHLSSPLLSDVDLVVAEDPELAELAAGQGLATLHIDPSVDDTVHNPIGWKQEPDPTLMVIADHPGIEDHFHVLAPHAGLIHLYGPALPGVEPAQHTPERPTGSLQAETAKNHLAVYTSPQLTATPTSHIQLALELAAAGTPLITPPDPTLTRLLDGHHLTATSPQQLAGHLETLQHPPSRERQSIPTRRHILTHHTRKHRFEQILEHLHIPTNPTPRISILLATKRPDYIEHALNNITLQNWPNKELILILHGEENFDLDHIQTLTQQLPYPTHTITCPNTATLGDCLNTGLDHATGHYITKMDDDDHYGPNHLTDLTTAHTYSNADIVGKWGNIVYLTERDVTLDYQIEREEKFGTHLPGATMLMERRLLNEYRFARVNRGVDATLWMRIRQDRGRLYSTHRFNFIRVRHDDHTYDRQEEGFLALSSGYLRLGLDLSGSML